MSNVTSLSGYRPEVVGPKPTRVMPANLEAEQAFLGALMIQNEVFAHAGGFLKPEHFSEDTHCRIYEIAAKMIGDGRKATPITIAPFLGTDDLAEGLTVRAYLARLCADATTIVNAKDYARTIVDMAARRSMIWAADDLIAQAMDSPVDMRPAEIAALALEDLGELIEDPAVTNRIAAGASAHKVVARAQAIMRGEAVALGVSTGLPDLDHATGGFRPGELWIVAGRPGMGKSIVGVTSATKVAKHAGDGALIFSLELPEDQFTARMLADVAFIARRPVTFQQIMRGQLNDEELWLIDDAQRRLSTMAIVVDYSSRLTVSDIKARIHTERKRMTAAGKTLRLVVIDYLKFIQAGDRYKGNRVSEVGEISAGLKQAAKDEEVCIVLLAQLNRMLESREDKRPGLSDLRESGDLEQDADVVAFIHREAYFIEKSPGARKGEADAVAKFEAVKNDAELILGKNRAGPTKTIHLWCDVACSTLSAKAKGWEG